MRLYGTFIGTSVSSCTSVAFPIGACSVANTSLYFCNDRMTFILKFVEGFLVVLISVPSEAFLKFPSAA